MSSVSGEAMDRPLPQRRRNYLPLGVSGLASLLAIAAVAHLIPHGLRVAERDIRIATIQQGTFRDHIVVRASAEPLHTIVLDTLETGRVEEVLATDWAAVKKGDLLFRLSNPQLRLDLVAREADRAQQISNLSLLRVSIESSRTEHQRRLLDMRFAVAAAHKEQGRNELLMEKGFIPKWTAEQSRDRLAQQEQALGEEQTRFTVEERIKREGLKQMEQAIGQLDAGLQVVNDSIEGLAVRAPISGRLTDFRLQVGEIVKPEQRIGRIDDPSEFKLSAEIDEYHLGRVAVGQKGYVTVRAHDYPVRIDRVFPQIKDGRFSVELLFTNAVPPGMKPGQSVDSHITLGEARSALMLPNDDFLNDSGGAFVFVVAPDGLTARRRAVRIGRRNDSQVELLSGLGRGERVIVSTYAIYGDTDWIQISR
jgi:HlyD family secretion protein